MSLAGIPSGSFRSFRLNCGPMKTQSLLTALFLSSALLTTACTRDVKLDTSGGGLRSNNRSGGNNGAATSFNLKSSFSLAAFLGERQIEVIQFIKVASETLDAGNNSFRVEKQDAEGEVRTYIVSTEVKDFVYEGAEGSVKSGVSKRIAVGLSLEGGQLEGLSAGASTICESKGKTFPCVMRTNADAVNKDKYYVNLQETVYNVVVAVGSSPDQLTVRFETEGKIIGSKSAAEKRSEQNIKMQMNLVVDRASLSTNTVKILSSAITLDYPNQNDNTKAPWLVKMDGANLTVILDTNCNRLNGSASFVSDPKKPATVMLFSDDSMSIQGKDWNKALAECGQRPVVDLSRLQVY